MAIHPAQLAAINDAFSVSAAEREWAERKRRKDKQDGFELVAVIGAGRASGQRSSSLGRGG